MTMPRQRDVQGALLPGDQIYRLHLMTQDDVPDVSRVERRCFPNPWPSSAYRRELQNPAQNYYVVLRAGADGDRGDPASPHFDLSVNGARATARALPRRSLLPLALGRRADSNGSGADQVVGFAGMWLAFDEAHITTIGIDPRHRGYGLGELLLLCLVDEAAARGANWLTLEVRVSNIAAQTLYEKYGFSVHGTRRRYYSDNNEDALIMWSRALSDAGFRAEIERRRVALDRRLGATIAAGELSPFSASRTPAGGS